MTPQPLFYKIAVFGKTAAATGGYGNFYIFIQIIQKLLIFVIYFAIMFAEKNPGG